MEAIQIQSQMEISAHNQSKKIWNSHLSQALNLFIASTMYSAKRLKDAMVLNKKRKVIKTINSPAMLGSVELKNHIVMAPMIRCRAIDNTPNKLMEEYYIQRSGAGLIITEGTSPSPNGLGYARTPGIYNKLQVEAWKKITSAVHEKGAKIFVQLLHTGRISHLSNMPNDAKILAPSAINAHGQIWTDSEQMQNFQIPKEMTKEDLLQTKQEYVSAARNAIEAGFDGVEIHAANGFLLEQFISPCTNVRNDNYSGNIENRCRFVLEIVNEIVEVIGKDKTAVTLSPFGVTNDMPNYHGTEATYKYLAEQLNKIGIVFLHLIDPSAIGEFALPADLKLLIRNIFKNTIIITGGHSLEKAEDEIKYGLGNLVAFDRPFINNPDLAERFKNNWPLSKEIKMDLFYSGDEKGYTDYKMYNP